MVQEVQPQLLVLAVPSLSPAVYLGTLCVHFVCYVGVRTSVCSTTVTYQFDSVFTTDDQTALPSYLQYRRTGAVPAPYRRHTGAVPAQRAVPAVYGGTRYIAFLGLCTANTANYRQLPES